MQRPTAAALAVGLVVGLLAMAAPAFAATPTFSAMSAFAATPSPPAGIGYTLPVEATAYGPSAQDNYPYGATDFFGQPLVVGDVAVDPSVIPLHTCLFVSGYTSPNLPAGGYYAEADDEGNAIQGSHVDLFMNASQAQVNAFGIQRVTVRVLGPSHNFAASGAAACAAYIR